MFPAKSKRLVSLESHYRGYGIIEANRPPHKFAREKNDRFKTELCVNLQNTGRCTFGTKCHYRHPDDTDYLEPVTNERQEFPDSTSVLSRNRKQWKLEDPVYRGGRSTGRNPLATAGKAESCSNRAMANLTEKWDNQSEDEEETYEAGRLRTDSENRVPSRLHYDRDYLKTASGRGFDRFWD